MNRPYYVMAIMLPSKIVACVASVISVGTNTEPTSKQVIVKFSVSKDNGNRSLNFLCFQCIKKIGLFFLIKAVLAATTQELKLLPLRGIRSQRYKKTKIPGTPLRKEI